MSIYMVAEVSYIQLFNSTQENITLRTDLGYFDNYSDCENYVSQYNSSNYENWVEETKRSFARLRENHYYPELKTDEEKNKHYGVNMELLKEPDYSFDSYIHQYMIKHYRTITINLHNNEENHS